MKVAIIINIKLFDTSTITILLFKSSFICCSYIINVVVIRIRPGSWTFKHIWHLKLSFLL